MSKLNQHQKVLKLTGSPAMHLGQDCWAAPRTWRKVHTYKNQSKASQPPGYLTQKYTDSNMSFVLCVIYQLKEQSFGFGLQFAYEWRWFWSQGVAMGTAGFWKNTSPQSSQALGVFFFRSGFIALWQNTEPSHPGWDQYKPFQCWNDNTLLKNCHW